MKRVATGSVNLPRREALFALASGLLLPAAMAAAPGALPASKSLTGELQRAVNSGKPLVVMVSLDGCVYCQAVRQTHLVALLAAEGLCVVQLNMRSRQPTRDFDGSAITHDERIRAWGVRLAPTLLFIGRDGVELAERLKGYSADCYSAYLAERLALAQTRIQS